MLELNQKKAVVVFFIYITLGSSLAELIHKIICKQRFNM